MNPEIAHLVEEAAAVLALIGIVWRAGRKAGRFFSAQASQFTGFMSQTTDQLGRIGTTLERFVEDLHEVRQRVDKLEREPSREAAR